MKIISWNVNGIRAVHRKKNLEEFIKKENPDIFFIQEIKGNKEQFLSIFEDFSNYEQFYHSALKPGYSGVGLWIKKTLNLDFSVFFDMGKWVDKEGRVIGLEFDNNVIMGIYFPNGGKSPEAWEEKLEFYDHFLGFIEDLRKNGKNVIWTGDVNTAHNDIDLARPDDNRGEIGFHPRERAWLDKVVKNDWLDIFRYKNPDAVVYSWWHQLTNSRARNVGWRIDYVFLDRILEKKVKNVYYLTYQLGSDHCPVVLEIEL